ncbi:MAG: L,D-transpeptidase family protein [Clostridia bacterium]|nr:L,D-transpeptidase family protein [Clostridia bacterium]
MVGKNKHKGGEEGLSGKSRRMGGAILLCALLLAAGLVLGRAAAAQQSGGGQNGTEAARRANVPEGLWILISIHQKRLTLYEGTQVAAVYPVATGAAGTPSPIGTWVVNSRFAGSLGGFGTRFLGLNVPWGQFGIHGTNKPDSIGSNASHGCIRMFVDDSEKLYDRIPDGTRVVVEGGPFGLLDTHLIPLAPGARGSHVAALQQRLRALGYYYGNADGIYGAGTAQAVRAARRALGLPASDGADEQFYSALGLILFE